MTKSYDERVKAQIEQFSDANVRWKVSKVHQYWMQNYVSPDIQTVFGCKNHIDFYASCVEGANQPSILSVGSGDGNLEIALARNLVARGITSFNITFTELSPIRQARAEAAVSDAGLSEYILFEVVDFNTDFPPGSFDLVFAHQTLHHIVELELLFKNIQTAIGTKGVFATIDMIGRNGHMRWPETQKYVDAYWKFIPDRFKFNFQFNAFHEKFVNFDCSKSGFEGVRAQDILPLLIKNFWFEGFVGVGGIIDPLFERGYGQSFDMDDPADVGLADFLAMINNVLIRSGEIKPTMIFAKMRLEALNGAETNIVDHLSPEYSMRDVLL